MKFRYILCLYTVFASIAFAFSQEQYNQVKALSEWSAQGPSAHGSSAFFYNPKRRVDGTKYLFDSWTNYGVIHTIDKQKFVIRNINLDIEANSFESKISKDSIFTFNLNSIEKILINSREFRNIYSENGKKIFEIIFENDKFSILKGFKVKLVSGSPNPMVNRSNDRYVIGDDYFVLKNNKVSNFKLNKRNILNLFDKNSDIKAKIEDYMKKYKYSYRKEEDIKKALTYLI